MAVEVVVSVQSGEYLYCASYAPKIIEQEYSIVGGHQRRGAFGGHRVQEAGAFLLVGRQRRTDPVICGTT
jgi:hypothetical protein